MKEDRYANEVQCEKFGLHIKYIAGIATAISLGSIVLAGHSNAAFVSQFSFASTVTSIILSVVAIWMSISGERTTNEIKNKILDASERLEKTTSNVENINSNYHEEITNRITSLEYIQNKLDEIVLSFTDVKDEMSATKEQVVHIANKINNLGEIDIKNGNLVDADIKDDISSKSVIAIYKKSLKYWGKEELKEFEIDLFMLTLEKLKDPPNKLGFSQFKELAFSIHGENDLDEFIESIYSRIFLILLILKKEDRETFKSALDELKNLEF